MYFKIFYHIFLPGAGSPGEPPQQKPRMYPVLCAGFINIFLANSV